MKSFQDFAVYFNVTEENNTDKPRSTKKRSRPTKITKNFDVERARKSLENIPTLSDAEMASQNPEATKAYEDDVRNRKTRRRSSATTSSVTPSPRTDAAQQAQIDIENEPERQRKKAALRARRQTQGFKDLQRAIDTPPKQTTPSPKQTTPSPKQTTPSPKQTTPSPSSVSLSLNRSSTPKVPKGPPLTVSTSGTSVRSSTSNNIAAAADKVMKQLKADKVADSVRRAKAWRSAGALTGVVGAGFDAKSGYESARKSGSSERRSIGAGAARAAGGLLGGAVGSTLGTAAGLPGAIVGGTAGYGIGTELGTKVYKSLTGDPGKKLTTQGVLSNVRKTVPYSIRSKVPAGARKAFRDLVTQTGRSYGQWSRSQGGNK